MNRMLFTLLTGWLAFSGTVAAGPNGSVIIVEGFSAPNSYSGVLPAMFDEWCDNQCVPTVTLQAVDDQKASPVGTIHAWGKEFTFAGATLQFKEFILYEFSGGQLFTISEAGGHPAGAFADPALVPPKVGAAVLVGGAEGSVVGGTGKYSKASGGYSTRLKVEDDGNGVFIYYDELYFRFREVNIE